MPFLAFPSFLFGVFFLLSSFFFFPPFFLLSFSCFSLNFSFSSIFIVVVAFPLFCSSISFIPSLVLMLRFFVLFSPSMLLPSPKSCSVRVQMRSHTHTHKKKKRFGLLPLPL
ncbi:hypothetical protein, unlikely [Trypanosoma brucei gambiense DAL972]|uniref:Uncharacterized protein n=1 Tax=Trypanosoma brucei gambiense (strain MHOM/CI/86/DAL972) TaxID=679716 RepID=D0A0A8_TRYB9|nr:hypothetical protein, unlikely [Trypanosoma brucei gambiense DAL972]CBH16666.1 hypothetical protein, unlikely [Trypanosoma brucei gambiense DAL972]|eukprot:XP_011778930.1 hypothetical protein, unlikely [Trypanosoma brucei gambiense DAL972]